MNLRSPVRGVPTIVYLSLPVFVEVTQATQAARALPPSQKKGEPTTLYSKGRILGYKRSKVNQYETKSIIKIEHVNDKADVDFCETHFHQIAIFCAFPAPAPARFTPPLTPFPAHCRPW